MKIGMISLGCPKNLVDGEVMLGLAERSGHTITADAADADVIVVNTCAFIDRAKQESVDAILEMAERRKSGGCQKLVVTGCLAERYRDELQAQIPEIDVVLGTGEVPEIVSALEGRGLSADRMNNPARTSGLSVGPDGMNNPVPTLGRGVGPGSFSSSSNAPRPGSAVPATLYRRTKTGHEPLGGRTELPTYIYDADTPRILATPRHFAYIKVAEGCDYRCAFCIIPRLRGHYRSRPADSIVREARDLVARGVREIILISQDTTFYGVDLAQRDALAALLRQLNGIDGLEWIRILYLYPTTITDAMLDAMAECDKVVKYVDLPLQHASDPLLKRMNRPGTRASYERLLRRIRERVPAVTLRTTFIVGFPGETDADVDELAGFLDAVQFDHVGIFTYSHEEGTSAGTRFDDDVPAGVKRSRRNRLMAQQKRIVRGSQKRRIGQRVRLVIDGRSDEHDLVVRGRLAGQAPEIDAQVFLTECDPSSFPPGAFIDAEIVGAKDYDLIARPLPDPEPCGSINSSGMAG
jgi:ribosomal protein S12 methylthiotransferase